MNIFNGSGRFDNVHGDEHLTDEQPVSRNRVIEDCDMLLKDIMVNWEYCKQKIDFLPDEDDIDLIEALHGEMEFYLNKHFRDSKDALESKKDNN